MNYVFFDIECACVYKHVAKICAFGYVITDENYNVLEREDLLINPKGKFHLTDRKGNEGLVLPYAYEDFKKYPKFPAVYEKIKGILEKNSFVCGHATLNDVNYLNLETRRYKLPSFNFEYHDTQFLYMNCEDGFSQQQMGLGAMAEKLGVEFTPHRAADDAYATMRVCEALCKREQTDVFGLIERYSVRAGTLKHYRITQPTSAGQSAYFKQRDAERAARAKAHEQFWRYVNKYMNKRGKGGSLEGKVFCFSRDIEDDPEISIKLVKAIFASGGKYTSHSAECNVYVARGQGGMRYQNAVNGGAAFVPLEHITASLEGL